MHWKLWNQCDFCILCPSLFNQSVMVKFCHIMRTTCELIRMMLYVLTATNWCLVILIIPLVFINAVVVPVWIFSIISIVRTHNFNILHVYSWCKSITFWPFKLHFLDWLIWCGINGREPNNVSYCQCWPSGLWRHVELLTISCLNIPSAQNVTVNILTSVLTSSPPREF